MTKSVNLAAVLALIALTMAVSGSSAHASMGSKRPPRLDTGLGSPPPRLYYDRAYVPGRVNVPCDDPGDCLWDYDRFLAHAQAYAAPRSADDIIDQINASMDGTVAVYTDPISKAALRTAILDALNLDFLLQDIDNAPITVDVESITEYAQYIEYDLTFRSRWVGAFTAVMLVPYGEGPFPAVIAAHGHGGGPAQYRSDYYGDLYPEQGFVILMPQFRNNNANGPEVEISSKYLLDGFAYGGMRIYETLLAFQFLLEQDLVESDRIFLIGHSGGSALANLTVRIEDRFAGYVSDWSVAYVHNYWIDDVIPDLYPYHTLINDFSTSTVPVMTTEYGYPDGPQEIFDFFHSLMPARRAASQGAPVASIGRTIQPESPSK